MSAISNEKRWCAFHARLESAPFSTVCFPALKVQDVEPNPAVKRDLSGLKVKRYIPSGDAETEKALQRGVAGLESTPRESPYLESHITERLGRSETRARIIFKDGIVEPTDEELRSYKVTMNDEMAIQGYIQTNLKDGKTRKPEVESE